MSADSNPEDHGRNDRGVGQIEQTKRKSLTFREAEPLLEIGSRYELEHWRNRLFSQFEDNAATLLPDLELVKSRVIRPEEKPAAAVNPFDL